MTSVGQGQLSISTAARTARAAYNDGANASAIRRLVAISGRQRGHRERDWHRYLRDFGAELEPYPIQLPLLNEYGDVVEETVFCILPHEMLAAIYRAGPAQRCVSLYGPGGREAVGEFWRNAVGNNLQWAENHPAVMQGLSEDCVPLLLHYDGCQIYNNSNHCIWDFASYLTEKSNVFDRQLLFLAVPEGRMDSPLVRNAVHSRVAAVLAWSADVMLTGTWPTRGFYAEEFSPGTVRWASQGSALTATGLRAAFVGIIADHKARIEMHDFKNKPKAMHICDGCDANGVYPKADPALSYQDFRVEAGWRETILSHAEYVRHAPARAQATYLGIPGITYDVLWRDLMHNFHLGIARDLIGSLVTAWNESGVLVQWCVQQGLDTSKPHVQLHWAFRQWCKRLGVQSDGINWFAPTSLGRWVKSMLPELNSKVKAARVKPIVMFLQHVSLQMPVLHTWVPVANQCIFGAARFLEILDCAGMWLTHGERARAVRAGRAMLVSYQWLAKKACRLRLRLWHLRPKHHYVDHQLLDVSTGVNIKALMCFGAEDFMGCVKRLGSGCHANTLTERLPLRYIQFLGARWQKRARSGKLVLH